MKILNLTQHVPTLEQEIQGVYTCKNTDHDVIRYALTFSELPTKELIHSKVQKLLDAALIARLDYTEQMFSHTYEGMIDASATEEEALEAANKACDKAMDNFACMIGGAPYLMPELERALKQCNIGVLYAYSERVGVETTNEDGSVTKNYVFKHQGFYQA